MDSSQYIQVAKAWVQKPCPTSVAATFDLSVPNLEKVISEIFISRNSRGYQSTSQMAKIQGLERDELFDRLHNDGLLERFGSQKHFLTSKGFEAGGRFATDVSVENGYWSVWPESILGTQKNPEVEINNLLHDSIKWLKSGCNSEYYKKWDYIISDNQEDGYLSTSRMISEYDSNGSIILQILESKGYLQRIKKNWTPTALGVAAGCKLRKMNEGGWYPVWNPMSTIVRQTVLDSWEIETKLKENCKFDSERNVYFLGEYIPYTSGYEQNPFSKKILDLKRKKKDAVDYFYQKLSFLYDLDFIICTAPGRDPKKYSGIDMLAEKLSNNMPCRSFIKNLRRKSKVVAQHLLSTSQKRSSTEESKTLKILNKEKWMDKRILLLDDISTTGGTINGSRKKILDETRPKNVHVLILGRTQK